MNSVEVQQEGDMSLQSMSEKLNWQKGQRNASLSKLSSLSNTIASVDWKALVGIERTITA